MSQPFAVKAPSPRQKSQRTPNQLPLALFQQRLARRMRPSIRTPRSESSAANRSAMACDVMSLPSRLSGQRHPKRVERFGS